MSAPCRRNEIFYVRLMFNDDTPCLYITDEWVFAGNPPKPYNLEGLEQKLKALPLEDCCAGYQVFFWPVFRDKWANLDDSTWLKFCQMLPKYLRHASSVEISKAHQMGDKQCQLLLWHLPRTVTTLLLSETSVNHVPRTVCQIGVSLPQLQELQIKSPSPQQPGYMPFAVRELLKQLPLLKNLTLKNVGAEQADDLKAWKPAFDLIRNDERFEQVTVVGASSGSAHQEHLLPLQYGPRLHAVKTKYLCKKEETSVEDFVNALISVSNRVDCLEHLLSTTDPSLYAKQALAQY